MPLENSAKFLLPALAGGLGAGALGAYTASRVKERPGEDEGERRSRILRNALGMGLGGAALGGSAAGVMHLINNMAPRRSLWEAATGKLDSLPGRAAMGTLGAAGGIFSGAMAAPHIDKRIGVTEKMMTDANAEVADKIQRLAARNKPVPKGLQIPYQPQDFVNRRLLSGKNALKTMGWGGAIGAGLMAASPELSGVMDSNIGSGIGGLAGGAGGLAATRGKYGLLGRLLGALGGGAAGAYLPRAGSFGEFDSAKNLFRKG